MISAHWVQQKLWHRFSRLRCCEEACEKRTSNGRQYTWILFVNVLCWDARQLGYNQSKSSVQKTVILRSQGLLFQCLPLAVQWWGLHRNKNKIPPAVTNILLYKNDSTIRLWQRAKSKVSVRTFCNETKGQIVSESKWMFLKQIIGTVVCVLFLI